MTPPTRIMEQARMPPPTRKKNNIVSLTTFLADERPLCRYLTLFVYRFGFIGWCTIDTTPSRTLFHKVFELGIPRKAPFWRPLIHVILKKRVGVYSL